MDEDVISSPDRKEKVVSPTKETRLGLRPVTSRMRILMEDRSIITTSFRPCLEDLIVIRQ